MTKNRTQKRAARQRQAETDERYLVARRHLETEPAWLRCANCDFLLGVRIEALFCSELCKQTADLVRYARRKVEQHQLDDPDIKWALQIRIAHLLGGGYPEAERRLSAAIREAVFARDKLCVHCGEPGTDIDHIAGSSDDLANLQLLCKSCHQVKTKAALVPASPEQAAIADALWVDRILPAAPLRLCDDTQLWPTEWRPLKAARRAYLLEELSDRGFDRSDFPGLSWSEMWDEIDHHYYLQDVMARDD